MSSSLTPPTTTPPPSKPRIAFQGTGDVARASSVAIPDAEGAGNGRHHNNNNCNNIRGGKIIKIEIVGVGEGWEGGGGRVEGGNVIIQV